MSPLAIEPTAAPKIVLAVALHAVEEVQELCTRAGLVVETVVGTGWRRALLIVEVA
jgi:hypothetical protein